MDIWDEEDDRTAMQRNAERDWERMSESFINDGYREGITAGKEEALQEGFDDGFTSVGVPLGRQIGTLRGYTAGLLAFLEDSQPQAHANPNRNSNVVLDADDRSKLIAEARSINQELAKVRMEDIAPPDAQAEEHMKVHAAREESNAGASAEQPSEDPMDAISSAFGSLGTMDSPAQRARRRQEALDGVQALATRISRVFNILGIQLIIEI
ncbi:hypothetical protein FRB96_001513 [Tulasnella sp. 330]|nr:hypothetical protein FRB96_001513 [Tulasnella sp. 330]KAG8886617.1 hypothetical protein FRB97_000036 [Tulasnella sp. 331]KAG8890690.1 hypothetical protein FRB98_006194 [Tulasnella sp. 332]